MVVEVGAKEYGAASMVLVVGCILTTYVLYLVEGVGDPFLPTISNTWVEAPGNYISRFCVSNGCFMLMIVQVLLYLGEDEKTIKAKVLMWMGLVGAFFLSWVGAICDSSSAPSCDGNNTIHTCCAVIFFSLYDIKMILTAKSRKELLLSLSACLAFCGRSLVTSDWALACFEWTNVAIIVYWTLTQLEAKCSHLYWSCGTFSDVQDDILWSKTTSAATRMTIAFYVSTLILTAILGLVFGYIPTQPHTLWYISDMWASVPGNWISRWAVVLGAHFGLIAIAGVYADTTNTLRKKLLILASFGLFGLMIVGCCNEKENITIHTIAAAVFFLSFDIYILGTLYSLRSHKERLSSKYYKFLSLLLPAFIALSSHLLRTLTIFPSLDPLLEWTDAIAIIVFLALDVEAYPNQCANSGIALARRPSSSSLKELKEQLLLI